MRPAFIVLAFGCSCAVNAADIQFDEPLEGSTRACVGNVCATSATASVSRSISGSIDPLDLLNGLPPDLLLLANVFDLGSYTTAQTLSLDLVNGGEVVNTLDVAFSVTQLQYTAAFLFRSDAGGALLNGPAVDVPASGSYQDVTGVLQSQVDLSGLPFPFSSLAAFFQPEFFPISVAMRTGPLDRIGPPHSLIPEPNTTLLLFAGLVSFMFSPRRKRA